MLAGCREKNPEAAAAEVLQGTLLQLRQGRFTPLPENQPPAAAELLPWTVQERVSDLTVLGERMYAGINGRGLAEVVLSADGESDFKYFYDPLLFRFRTLTTLVPEQETLLCHLYFNKMLNIVGESDLKLQGISLLRLAPASGIYQFLTPPFQEQHPEWEAVGFIAETPRRFFLQWKYSDHNRTLFSYSLYDPSEGKEEEIGELSYRQSYGFQNVRSSPVVEPALSEARKRLDTSGISTAYQLSIRFEDVPLPRRLEYHPDDFASAERIQLYSLAGSQRGERVLLLLPEGLLLESDPASSGIHRYRLPTLPAGYEYRLLLIHEAHLLASWEHSAFTVVGAAGIFFARFPVIP